MPFGIGANKRPLVTEIAPQLPGPWQYLGLLQILRAMEPKLRNLPVYAYPILGLAVWQTVQKERKLQREALFDAERVAIRKSQRVYIAKTKPKKFLFF